MESQEIKVNQERLLLDAAIDQYAIENNRLDDAPVTFNLVKPYLPRPSELRASNDGTDLFGRPYIIGKVRDGAKVNEETKAQFDVSVIPSEFWTGY